MKAPPDGGRAPRAKERVGCSPLAAFGVVLAVLAGVAHAQSGPISLTNAFVAEGIFRFEIVAPAGSECEVESADTAGGPWRLMPGVVDGSGVRVPLDHPAQYFRARCDTRYSVNRAGYVTLRLPPGYSAIANPFDQGGNTVAEVLPAAPMVLFKFDAVRQVYTANQFDFGSWALPQDTLAPGEGAWLVWGGSEVLEVTLGGLLPEPPRDLELEGGWNFIGAAASGESFPLEPLDGDRVAPYDPSSGFVLHEYMDGEWTPPPPVVSPGEGFWYQRNLPNPNALPPAPVVFFNNRLVAGPGTGVDARLFDVCGCPMSGTNWLAQLSVSVTGMPFDFQPVGEPLPFREGIGAGYLDISSGAIRRLPVGVHGVEVEVELWVWDGREASTYEEAVSRGAYYARSSPVRVWGTTPPAAPATLVGLESFARLDAACAFEIIGQPTAQNVFLGNTARFKVQLETAPPWCPVPPYQWQKAAPSGDWVDLPGATSAELIVHPVGPESAGDYRVVLGSVGTSDRCRGVKECQVSQSASLRVLEPPRLTQATWNLAADAFSYVLIAEPGYDYAVEVSTNLSTWSAHQTVRNLAGSIQLIEPEAGEYGARYFRARVLNP